MNKLLYLVLAIVSFVPTSGVFAVIVDVDGINYRLYGGEAEVIRNTPLYSGDVVIPSSFNYQGITYNVTSIGRSAFSECRGLTSVTIPDSVTSIESNTFACCI